MRAAPLMILTVLCLAPARPALAASPRIDYMLHCQGCHLADGTGVPGTIPDLRGSMAVFLSVPGGREFLIQVPGTAQAPLADNAVAELLNWMLLEFSAPELPPDFDPYTGEEVGTYRKQPLTDVSRVRQELIEAIDRSR